MSRVKLDARLVSERMVVIRTAASDTTTIVDASEPWRVGGLVACCQPLADSGVVVLEQPLSAQDDATPESFVYPLPICADESYHTRGSLEALYGRYEVVDIKLDKTDGLVGALALATEAREQGFALMPDCMLCTSRAIDVVLPSTPQVNSADFDGPIWSASDAESALHLTAGQLHLQGTNTVGRTWPSGIPRSFHPTKWAEIWRSCGVNSGLCTSSQKSRALHNLR